ncbi:MAG: YitT family protein, partial [Clostridia bacterium]|nr:YitT family protein [Clostridia bacterium]
GASGAAIVVNIISGFPTGTAILLINIPLFILGFFAIGRGFVVKSLFATFISSAMIDIESHFYSKVTPLTTDPLLCAVAGGVLAAVGMGIVFKFGGSTGGTDIVVRLIRKKRRDLPTGKIFLMLDSAIIAVAAIATRNIGSALYAAIALFITSRVLDAILYGTDEAKFLVIISSVPEEIAEKLLSEVDVGLTYINGSGAYTKSEKKVILCAVKKYNYPRIKDLVHKIDSNAFMIVSSASEVYGEGYKLYGQEEI